MRLILFVAMIDLNGNIAVINREGAELPGYNKEEIIGKNFIGDFIIKPEQCILKAMIKTISQIFYRRGE